MPFLFKEWKYSLKTFNAPSIGKADEKQLKMSLEKIHQFRLCFSQFKVYHQNLRKCVKVGPWINLSYFALLWQVISKMLIIIEAPGLH